MEKKELSQALKLTKSALGMNSNIPGLDCFYFNSNKVTAFNSHLAIVATLPDEFPYKGYVPGNPLVKMINEMGEDITITVKDDTILLQSGSAKVKLKSISNTQPLFVSPEIEEPQILPVSSTFINGLKRCMSSLSGGKSISPEEAGITVVVSDGICSLYSTNGITISTYSFKMDEAGEDKSIECNMILPAAMCEQLGFLMDELLACPNEFILNNDMLVANYNKLSLYCSFYASPPKKSMEMRVKSYLEDIEFGVLPKMLDDCLRKCEIVDSEIVKLSYKSDELKVTSSSKGLGEVVEEFPFQYSDGAEGSITLDIKQLRKVLDDAANIAFSKDYVVLEGKDNHFKHIIPRKAV